MGRVRNSDGRISESWCSSVIRDVYDGWINPFDQDRIFGTLVFVLHNLLLLVRSYLFVRSSYQVRLTSRRPAFSDLLCMFAEAIASSTPLTSAAPIVVAEGIPGRKYNS